MKILEMAIEPMTCGDQMYAYIHMEHDVEISAFAPTIREARHKILTALSELGYEGVIQETVSHEVAAGGWKEG